MNSKEVFCYRDVHCKEDGDEWKNRQLEKEKTVGGKKESKIQTVKDAQAWDMFSHPFFLNNGVFVPV